MSEKPPFVMGGFLVQKRKPTEERQPEIRIVTQQQTFFKGLELVRFQ